MSERDTVPCGICGTPTPMTGTKRCDRCWELEGRIHRDPELARTILASSLSDEQIDAAVEAACDYLTAGELPLFIQRRVAMRAAVRAALAGPKDAP